MQNAYFCNFLQYKCLSFQKSIRTSWLFDWWTKRSWPFLLFGEGYTMEWRESCDFSYDYAIKRNTMNLINLIEMILKQKLMYCKQIKTLEQNNLVRFTFLIGLIQDVVKGHCISFYIVHAFSISVNPFSNTHSVDQ